MLTMILGDGVKWDGIWEISRFRCMCCVYNVSILYNFVFLLDQNKRRSEEGRKEGKTEGKKGSVRNTSFLGPLGLDVVPSPWPR